MGGATQVERRHGRCVGFSSGSAEEGDPPGGLRSHGTPGRFAPVVPLLPPAPPTVSCVPASRELVSGGPLPLPLRGGAQAPGRVSLLRTTAAVALFVISV